MSRIPGLRRIFRLDASARRVERDVHDELEFHFAERVAELVAGGLSPEQARAEAERRFGDVGRYRSELGAIDQGQRAAERRAARWEAIAHDLRVAARGLRRQPGFTLAVVLTLALGIGANATMFGIVDRLVLQPPPHVANAERVHGLALRIPFNGDTVVSDALAYPLVADLRAGVPAFEGLVAYTGATMSMGRGTEAQPVRAALVTGDFFTQLGVGRPALGRVLAPTDDAPGAPGVAVLGHGFWQRHFAGDPDVVGRTLQLDRGFYTVVGVAPERFRGLDRRAPDLWVPLVPTTIARGDADALTMYGWQWLSVAGRLRPGIAPGIAQAQVAATIRGVAERDEHLANVVPALRSVLPRASLADDADARVALLLGGVSCLVLLIACANVANLLLARALRRGRETAVRLALGVSRRRLAGQFLAESLLLAVAGGAAALVVVRWGGGLIAPLLLGEEGMGGADRRVLAFTALATVAAGLVSGLVPALQASRPHLGGALRQGARGGARHGRTRAALLVAQAALGVVLLVGTGLFVRSLARVNAAPLGLEVHEVLVARMRLQSSGYEGERARALYDAMAGRVARLPGVRSTALALSLPLATSYADRFRIPGRDSLPRVPDGGPYVNAVSPGYFATTGMRVLRGRALDADDGRAGAARVVVINDAMARLYWPGESPIGACVQIGADSLPCSTVVGVSENARRQNIVEGTSLQYFVPIEHDPTGADSRVLLVRPAPGTDRAVLAALVRQAMQGAAPDLPYADVYPMAELLEGEMRPWRMGAALFAAFGLLALLLAAVGLYGVISYAVSQRTHEMGVRLALGARSATLVAMVLREGVTLAATGALVGVVLALAGAPLVADLLYETSPRDPLVIGGVVLALMAVATAACLFPAWRASRVDAVVALRAD